METSKQKTPLKKKPLTDYGKYSNLAFQMLGTILLGVFIGIKLDKWTGFKFPVFTFFLTILSVVLAIYVSVKDVLKK